MASLWQTPQPIGTATFGVIPAEEWNAMLDRLGRNRPLRLRGLRGGEFRHPFNVHPLWNPVRERWEASVWAGYVNGEEVGADLRADQAPALTIERTGEKRGSATVRAWLSEQPSLPLGALRALGPGGSERAPYFFRFLGVGEPSGLSLSDLERGVIETSSSQKPTRKLRACELVLRKGRPATRATWSGDGAAFELAEDSPADAAARVDFRPAYSGIVPDPFGLLDGSFAQPDYDELHLATVYLLSPPHAADDALPDGAWQPYVRHRQFWNLRHAYRGFTPQAGDPLTFPVGIAAGVASGLIQSIVEEVSGRIEAARQYLNARQIEGRFWDA